MRNATSGLFLDMYFSILTAGRVFFSVVLFAIPAVPFVWLGRRRMPAKYASLAIIGWLVFFVAALAVLFPLNVFR